MMEKNIKLHSKLTLLLVSTFLNLIGGVILITIVWKENMDKTISYKPKSPFWPLSLVVILWGMMVTFIYLKK